VSQAVNSTLDLETVLSTIVAKAVQLSGTEAGAIYVYDDRQREFQLRATYGMDQELIDALTQQHIDMDEPNVRLILAEREPVQVSDLKEEAPSDINEIRSRRALLTHRAPPSGRTSVANGLSPFAGCGRLRGSKNRRALVRPEGRNGLELSVRSFAENDIDASVLPHLTDQSLKELGVSLGHRLKILAAVREFSGPTPAALKPSDRAATPRDSADPLS
jgi:GAF domain-containing protein